METASALDEAKRILDEGFSAGANCSVQPIRGTLLSHAFVAGRDEPGSALLLLKKFGRRRSEDSIAQEHRLMANLRQSGCALVPEVIPSSSGASYFTDSQSEHIFALYTYIPSSPRYEFLVGGLSLEEVTSAGRSLADIHHALRGVERPLLRAYTDMDLVQWARLPHKTKSIGREDVTILQRSIDELDEQQLAALPRQLIHSDIHPANLAFRNGTVTGVFDFETAHIQCRLWDIVYGALMVSVASERGFLARPELFSNFVEAYSEKAPLSDLERAALQGMTRLCAVVNTLWAVDHMTGDTALDARLRHLANWSLDLLRRPPGP